LDYKFQIKGKANQLTDFAFNLLDKTPKSDHKAIYEVYELGDNIASVFEDDSEFSYYSPDRLALKILNEYIGMYRLKSSYFSAATTDFIEEIRVLATNWYKSTVTEEEFNYYVLSQKVFDQTNGLTELASWLKEPESVKLFNKFLTHKQHQKGIPKRAILIEEVCSLLPDWNKQDVYRSMVNEADFQKLKERLYELKNEYADDLLAVAEQLKNFLSKLMRVEEDKL